MTILNHTDTHTRSLDDLTRNTDSSFGDSERRNYILLYTWLCMSAPGKKNPRNSIWMGTAALYRCCGTTSLVGERELCVCTEQRRDKKVYKRKENTRSPCKVKQEIITLKRRRRRKGNLRVQGCKDVVL